MYHKRLQELQKMEDNKQVLTRVANYPVVKDTWNKVSEVYQRGKDGSRILRFCGGVAEGSASLAYRASKPVIEKLPVSTVNDYAVQKLEVLEEKYPVLVKPTGEVVDDLKAYSTAKMDDVKTYSTSTFNRLAEVARLNAVLDMADAVVDKILPPQEMDEMPTAGEEQSDTDAQPDFSATEEVDEQQSLEASTRVRMLTDKMKRRAYDVAMSKVGAIQKRSQAAVGQLRHTVDLIDYAKQNMRNMKMSDAQEKVKTIYGEITKESDGEENLPANANLEKKTIYVARVMTLRARSTFATISRLSYALPTYARTAVNEAYNYSENVYQSFSKASSYSDFSRQMINEMRQRVNFLEDVANNLTQYVFASPPLKWLASKDSERAVQPEPTNPPDSEPENEPDANDTTTEPNVTASDDSVLNSTNNFDDSDDDDTE